MTRRRLIIGCGYLGRRVARQWTVQGDTVFALTRTPAHAEELRQCGLAPIVGDVTDVASLAGLPEVDTILFAVGLDRRSEHSQRDVYVGGLENVLQQIQGDMPRVVYISSTSVYGQSQGEWVDESSACQPDSPNGQVCLDAERLLQQKVPQANILRLAGIYGPGRVVGRAEALRAGQIPEGNPDAWLNLIHIDDAVAAVLACERQGTPGATCLVCDGHPCRRRDYYSLLAALIGAPAPFALSEQSPTSNLNKRCCNRRLRDELHVVLRYPRFNIGLPNALTTREGR
jgi:nucleoside-diphosphate-sugar epimerase